MKFITLVPWASKMDLYYEADCFVGLGNEKIGVVADDSDCISGMLFRKYMRWCSVWEHVDYMHQFDLFAIFML